VKTTTSNRPNGSVARKRKPLLLVAGGVPHRQSQRVFQSNDRIGEVDTMLLEERLSLGRIPFQLHDPDICTDICTRQGEATGSFRAV